MNVFFLSDMLTNKTE